MIQVVQGNLGGCARGLDRQEKASLIVIACIAFISVPLGYYLPHSYDLGATGFYEGYGIGLIVAAILFSFLLYNSDWGEIADEL